MEENTINAPSRSSSKSPEEMEKERRGKEEQRVREKNKGEGAANVGLPGKIGDTGVPGPDSPIRTSGA